MSVFSIHIFSRCASLPQVCAEEIINRCAYAFEKPCQMATGQELTKAGDPRYILLMVPRGLPTTNKRTDEFGGCPETVPASQN